MLAVEQWEPQVDQLEKCDRQEWITRYDIEVIISKQARTNINGLTEAKDGLPAHPADKVGVVGTTALLVVPLLVPLLDALAICIHNGEQIQETLSIKCNV